MNIEKERLRQIENNETFEDTLNTLQRELKSITKRLNNQEQNRDEHRT